MNDHDASRRDNLSLDDRQAAERKLCRLFKSFGIDALAERERLIDPYLDRAAAFWRPHAGIDIAMLACDEAETDLEIWFKALLAEHLDDDTDAVMIGRAAFLMCRGPARFADQLLTSVDDLDDLFVAELIDHAPRAVPPAEHGEMHHQAYEAWSPSAVMARALPAEGGLLQSLAGLVRRDGRAVGFGWRGTGTTS